MDPHTTDAAVAYAQLFASLGDPTRVRLLHAVATAPDGVTIGDLVEQVGVGQSTCSHHVRKLADAGLLDVEREGTMTRVRVNHDVSACFPQAADAVMGMLTPPAGPAKPARVRIRALDDGDWPTVRRIYAEGIATGNATFETEVAPADVLAAMWLPGHRWVAVVDGQVAGWASATRASTRACYSGVVETSVYVGDGFRGRGVGWALITRQVAAADADPGVWTLQTSIFPENRVSLALHRGAGFRIVGIRQKIAQVDGRWQDTVLVERRTGDRRASRITRTSAASTRSHA